MKVHPYVLLNVSFPHKLEFKSHFSKVLKHIHNFKQESYWLHSKTQANQI